MKDSIDSTVWLYTPGGVVGWSVSELNYYIDRYNRLHWTLRDDFFDWLSYETGDTYYHFWSLCPVPSNIHHIKGAYEK